MGLRSSCMVFGSSILMPDDVLTMGGASVGDGGGMFIGVSRTSWVGRGSVGDSEDECRQGPTNVST